MKSFPVTFLMIFAFELWPSEAGPLFSFTGSLNVPSGANTNGSILDEILTNFRREISEQDTVLENNLGNVNKSLDFINNAVGRIDHSLSDLVPVLMQTIVETRTLMNKMDKRLLACENSLVEPTNAQTSWNAAEDRVKITCNEGFMTESKAFEQTVKCFGGRWSDYEPCKKICPEPFVVEGDLCLRLVVKLQNWENAKDNCAQMGHGATLAMLPTASEAESFKDFVDKLVINIPSGFLWLGATEDTSDRGNWYWLDESPVTMRDELHWSDGEPNEHTYSVREDCLDFKIRNRGLNDDNCHRNVASVCEIPASDHGFVQYMPTVDNNLIPSDYS